MLNGIEERLVVYFCLFYFIILFDVDTKLLMAATITRRTYPPACCTYDVYKSLPWEHGRGKLCHY